MLVDHLNITTAQVRRISIADDGTGGEGTVTTVLTTLSKCAIYPAGMGGKQLQYVSDSLQIISSHVLLTLPSYYTWNKDDKEIVFDSQTYKIMGFDPNVMDFDEMAVVALELVK